MLEVVGTPICSPQTLTAPCAIEVWPRIEPRSREANSNALACWAVVVLALWNCGNTRRQAALGRVFTLDRRINQNEITRNESKTTKRPTVSHGFGHAGQAPFLAGQTFALKAISKGYIVKTGMQEITDSLVGQPNPSWSRGPS